MKISYKAIRSINSCANEIIDDYYGLSISDFLDDDDIEHIDQQRIYVKILEGKLKRERA